MIPDEAVAVAEHEREAESVEQQAAQARVHDALHQHVDCFARAAEARFQHREAHLHAEHEERRHQRPDRIQRVDDVVALQHRVRRERAQAQSARDSYQHRDQQQQAALPSVSR